MKGDSGDGILTDNAVDGRKLVENRAEFFERNLVGSIAEGFSGIGMGFHEHTVTSGSDRSSCKDWGEISIASAGITFSAGTLHRMGCVKDDADSCFVHPGDRSHIGYEGVVSEAAAAFGHKVIPASESIEFVGYIRNVQGGEKLAFFHIYDPTRFRSRFEQVGLPAEKSWDLNHIDEVSSNAGLFSSVNICRDWHAHIFSDSMEKAAAGLTTWAAEGTHGAAICLVVTGFENHVDIGFVGDCLDLWCEIEEEFL
jgi:hypothetical protein